MTDVLGTPYLQWTHLILTSFCDPVKTFPILFVPSIHQTEGVFQGLDLLLGFAYSCIQLISLPLELFFLLSSLQQILENWSLFNENDRKVVYFCP